jgi:pyruvate/2-oxoglutarate dehydrogenase complex dihydrolipoamide acyltransferase (E2) component
MHPPDDEQMSEMVEIKLERLSVNDDEYTFVERLVDDGAEVAAGAIVASVESAKTVFEIEAPVAGFVFFLKAPKDEVAVGERIAVISPIQEFDKARFCHATDSRAHVPRVDNPIYAKFTARALELAKDKGIDVEYFRDFDAVTSADVEAYLSQATSRVE